MVDTFFDYNLPFNNRFDLLKFQEVLRNYSRAVQLICYNLDDLTKGEQMLFNEIYYYNSPFFNITSIVKNHFITYSLTKNRILDDRENYQKYEI